MYKGKTIGVVVITYNGEAFIFNQLNSILNQSVTPDSVSIFDDCSSDNTIDIIKEFIENNNLSSWHIFKRESNVGWRENVLEALIKCKMDFVFWSDQDDVWDNNKIEVMISSVKSDKHVAVYSSWRYIDTYNYPLNIISGTDTGNITEINPLYKTPNIPPLLGCSACFQNELVLQLSNVIPCEFDSPDWILYILGVTLGKVVYIDKPLFSRRVHEYNLTTSPIAMKRAWIFSNRKQVRTLYILKLQHKTLCKILKFINKVSKRSNICYLENEIKYLNYRINFMEKKENFFHYLYSSFKQNYFWDFCYTFLSDVLFVISRM